MARSGTVNPVGKIRISNAIYPVAIGLAVVGWLFWREFDPGVFNNISFTWTTAFWIFMAVLCMAGRDLGYMIRIRILSGKELSWWQAFRVIVLWEFTSAITPSAVGGTSVAIVYVHKEGISVGRSSTIVMLTSFMDEVYFIVMFPLLVLAVGGGRLFDISAAAQNGLSMGLVSIAVIGYSLKLAYILVLSYGLFINPRGLKWLLLKIFKPQLLHRWYRNLNNVGTEIITGSKEIKKRDPGFWIKSFAATFLSWSSRYLVAGMLVLAFFGAGDQFMLFARQLVMWIMMLVMPTPGGSGFAEYIFTVFCSDLMYVEPDLQKAAATLIALAWRMITYYPYLIAGAIIFPRWLNKHFSKGVFSKKVK